LLSSLLSSYAMVKSLEKKTERDLRRKLSSRWHDEDEERRASLDLT
jgi:hypothetical protein